MKRMTERVQALTDGVFAIVMTLLVFEIEVPGPDASFPQAIWDLLPNFLSYVISFVILGIYWVEHRTQFLYIHHCNQTLLWLNILFLMCVSLIPFSAALLGQHSTERTSVIIYGVNLIVVALAHEGLWAYATRTPALVNNDITPDVVQREGQLLLLPVLFYLLAIALSFVAVWISFVIYLLVPLPYIGGIIYRFFSEDEDL